MTQLNHEEIRDGLLALFEENEEKLSLYTSQVEKIEDEAIAQFEKKVIAAKNRLVQDTTITDDDLEKKYLEEVEEIRKGTLEDTERLLHEFVEKMEKVTK